MSLGDLHLDAGAIEHMMRSPGGFVAQDLARRAVAVESAAKRACPVDTGRLRSSITHRLGEDREGLFADVGTAVEYAPHVEFGTFRTRAQPFLRPALRAAGDR